MKNTAQAHKISAVILAGGKSSRMGKNKAFLTMDGKPDGKTFLSHIHGQLHELNFFEELFVSIGELSDTANTSASINKNLKPVNDIYSNCGPIGGIYSALCACRSDYLFSLSCDMPLFQKDLAHYMLSFIDDNHDAFVVVDRHGYIQPHCAIYAAHTGSRAKDTLENAIKAGNYCLRDSLETMRIRYIPLCFSIFSDDLVHGLNTQEEYADFVQRMQRAPKVTSEPIVAVCGVQNSGKTTLLTNIIPLLKKRGLRVAAVKHDGHDFESDVPGTDSYRLRQAGAYASGIYSSKRYMLSAEQTGISPDFFRQFFHGADLIMLEGGKYTPYPKIEIVRRCISQQPVSDPSTLLAIVSDLAIQLDGIPTLALDDYNAVAELLIKYCDDYGN